MSDSKTRSYTFAVAQSGCAALFFAVGAVLSGVGRGIENGGGGIGLMLGFPPNVTVTNHTRPFLAHAMKDEHIRHRWDMRQKAAGPKIVGELFAALGWFLAIPPVSCIAEILHDGGVRSAAPTITYAFVAASVLTMVQLTSLAGTAQTAEWMSSTWPLLRASSVNEEGELTAAQVFELSYFLSQSRTLWLFAMDDLLLAFGVGAAACLIYTSSQVNRALGHLGVAIVLLCCIDFAFEVSRFVDWRVSSNAVVITSLFLDAVLLPAWLIGIGLTLQRITNSGGAYTATVERAVAAATTHVEMEVGGNGIKA